MVGRGRLRHSAAEFLYGALRFAGVGYGGVWRGGVWYAMVSYGVVRAERPVGFGRLGLGKRMLRLGLLGFG